MSNRLQYETSPYLLQHKDNPVDWYPWCGEAFARAGAEDKPVFLSIGYSSCHWCHVLAHESFEDEEIAGLLNRYFIAVKVDREERPDIDSVYMSVCQAFTGGGGWPLSIFLSPAGKPFYAGTYFPKTSRGGMIGLKELLLTIHRQWVSDRAPLLRQAEAIVAHLNQGAGVSGGDPEEEPVHSAGEEGPESRPEETDGTSAARPNGADRALQTEDSGLADLAVSLYKRMFDGKYGGFGQAPKFPTPHNLLFLLSFYERHQDKECLMMAEYTLLQMYRGGLFDHVGFGFCRYSTDERFLVPHFEKMLYDNALLILAYCKIWTAVKKPLYLEIARKTADYILREMTVPGGGFACAQDADSEGEEGKYYLFSPDEVISVLGEEDGETFNRLYDITKEGNFEGKNIPNLLNSAPGSRVPAFALQKLDEYRKKRCALHLDGKVLTAWNSLMIAALCELYLVSRDRKYLDAARDGDAFLKEHLCEGDTLFVSWCGGKRGVRGFLDDYAGYAFAQLALYKATLESEYLERAERLCGRAETGFGDAAGGFYLYGADGETLIIRPKETYDGALPSGNSLMAYNLVHLALLTGKEAFREAAERQLAFLSKQAAAYPPGFAMFLTALLDYREPRMKITVVPDAQEDRQLLPLRFPPDLIIHLEEPSEKQPLLNGRTTFYVCKGHVCLPPVNELEELSGV